MFEVSLKDKTCIITGASQGIGRAIALTLAQAELKGMTIIDIKKDESSEDTVKEIEKMGTKVNFVIGDVSSEDTVKEAVKVTMDTWGKIDILVNNAGIANMCDLEGTTPEMWDRVLNVNLRSVFLTMKYCTEVMKKQGYGSIVNMSSISGVTGGSTGPEYGASKAGIITLTKDSAKLLVPDNIRVNAVAPGTIATDMIKRNYSKLTPEQLEKKLATIPMKRMGDPEEVGKAVLFLASDMGSYVSGDVLMVTGSRMS